MAATRPASLPADDRNRLVGMLLIAAGAVLLAVSLFLDWFEPSLSAWTVFEVWDLVLAALALMALIAVASRLQFGARRPDSWLLVPALVAPVVVVAALLNHPPAAQGPGQDPMIGVWLALGGSLLMALGAMAAIARISVAIDRSQPPVAPRQPAATPQTPAAAPAPPATPPQTPPAAAPPGARTPPAADEQPATRPTGRILP